MKFLLSEIKKNARNKPFNFDQEVDVSEIASWDNDIQRIDPIRVQGHCVLDGDEIIFTLNMSGEMILPCARTLADVTHPFKIKEIEVFSESSYYGNLLQLQSY